MRKEYSKIKRVERESYWNNIKKSQTIIKKKVSLLKEKLIEWKIINYLKKYRVKIILNRINLIKYEDCFAEQRVTLLKRIIMHTAYV